MNFGKILKNVMVEERISAKNLAAKTGITAQSITNYRHNRTIPTFDYVMWMFEALDYGILLVKPDNSMILVDNFKQCLNNIMDYEQWDRHDLRIHIGVSKSTINDYLDNGIAPKLGRVDEIFSVLGYGLAAAKGNKGVWICRKEVCENGNK